MNSESKLQSMLRQSEIGRSWMANHVDNSYLTMHQGHLSCKAAPYKKKKVSARNQW